MQKLTDLGLAAWIDSQNSGLGSFFLVEFEGVNFNVSLFSSVLYEVVSRYPIFSLRLTPTGQMERREEGTYALLLNCQDEETQVQDGLLPTIAKEAANTLLKESLFLVVTCTNEAEGKVRTQFVANMAILNPANVYLFLHELSIAYQLAVGGEAEELFSFPKSTASYQGNTTTELDFRHLAQYPLPSLPWRLYNETKGTVQNICWCLPVRVWQQLQDNAVAAGVKVSVMLRAVFCAALALYTKRSSFRLSLPFFKHEKSQLGGETWFSDDFYIQAVDVNLEASLLDTIGYLRDSSHFFGNEALSGVSLLRELTKLTGCQEIAPVVYTDLLACGSLFSGVINQTFGQVQRALSRGVNVGLDVQVVQVGETVGFNWDVNEDLISASDIAKLVDCFKHLLRLYAYSSANLGRPIGQLVSDSKYRLTLKPQVLSDDDFMVAGRLLSKKELTDLIERILGRQVKLIDEQSGKGGNFSLLVESSVNEPLSIHEIQNTLATHFLGQLNPKRIVILPSSEFDRGNELNPSNPSNYSAQGQLPVEVVYVVAAIFSAVLGTQIDPLTMRDTDFFEMGGNSLLATQVVIETNKYFLYAQIGIADMFRLRSIHELAIYLYEKDSALALKVAQTVQRLLIKTWGLE
ncbi:Phenyloxazoline synthase MbtB [Oligella urethralis]|uniref:phosphopantetheine-binding protein n=1 Tax=Oligella urethralis TaxID=90245 RepID=UPI000E064DC4|nr:phosphopantetheine-binding protein [Oligella urethralis]SUA53148.1 Phenyloxazoline synthase MbtB [Oligella urethralis]